MLLPLSGSDDVDCGRADRRRASSLPAAVAVGGCYLLSGPTECLISLHQCVSASSSDLALPDKARQWTAAEIELVRELADQVGTAIATPPQELELTPSSGGILASKASFWRYLHELAPLWYAQVLSWRHGRHQEAGDLSRRLAALPYTCSASLMTF